MASGQLLRTALMPHAQARTRALLCIRLPRILRIVWRDLDRVHLDATVRAAQLTVAVEETLAELGNWRTIVLAGCAAAGACVRACSCVCSLVAMNDCMRVCMCIHAWM